MLKKLVPYAAVVAALAVLLGGSGEVTAFPPGPPLQGLELYSAVCLGGADPDQGTLPMTCPGPEDKSTGAQPDTVSGGISPAGNRVQLGYSYSGPGWPEGITEVDGEMLSDNISNYLDYLCDGTVDQLGSFQWTDSTADTQEALAATVGSDTINVSNSNVLPGAGGYIRIESDIDVDRTKIEVMILMAKSGDGPGGAQDTMTVTRIDPSEHTTGARIDIPANTTTPGPYDFVSRSTTWGNDTGIYGEDESYLNEIIPLSLGTLESRARAAYTHFWYGGSAPIPIPGGAISVNSIQIEPSWKADSVFSIVTFGGSPASPTSLATCADTPQGGLGHNLGQYGGNPATPGLYARWEAHIAYPDAITGTYNFVYMTNCKAIGGTFDDTDADCLASSPNDGHPGVADTDDNDPDVDDDGLLDGIEVAWGSDPTCADSEDTLAVGTDGLCNGNGGDGYTDLEEMIGPSYLLTDPTSGDTDGDSVGDRTLKVDTYDTDSDADGVQDSGSPDGIPDWPDWNGDSSRDPTDGGMTANADVSGDGSSIRNVGYVITSLTSDYIGDNCPNVANAAQTNTDEDTFGANGDSNGDACDTDDDNDSIVDAAEDTFVWDSGSHTCSNWGKFPFMDAGDATPLDKSDPDTDDDGVLDGIECELGSNPLDAGDSPGKPADDADKDGISSAAETAWRSQGFSGTGDEDADGDTFVGKDDPDSDGDGLSDGCEGMVTNTSLLRTDTDYDGVADNLETWAAARATAYCGATMDDFDGDGVLNDVDNCLFVSNVAQTNTDAKTGNGKGIAGDDGTVPWSTLSDTKGDACDGDKDNDGLRRVADADPDDANTNITYDDNDDGTWKGAGDDGTSWDANTNAKLDGREGLCPLAGNADTDGDGLLDKWEYCKWGSSPIKVDSDGNGKGDCTEVVDTNGDGSANLGDVVNAAKAGLLGATFGQDGDFDINGDNAVNISDVVEDAKFALIAGRCK